MAFSFDLAVILQRERRMKKSHECLPEIPFELVIEILTSLPAKSLMRFKSVSKLWSTLICSRNFTNRFLRDSSSPPRLYMSLSFFDNSHLKNKLLSSSPISDSDGTTMSSFDADQDLTIPAMRGYASNVFRGLMCFIVGPRAKIYNTTTRQLVVLPDIEESNIIADDQKDKKLVCHIGHDPVHDQYIVLCIAARRSDKVEEHTFLTEHWVFLLGGDGSSRWQKIPSRCPPHIPVTQVLNFNGRMHYLATLRTSYVLVSFDINSKVISMLQVPEDIFWPSISIDLIEYCGKIALLHYPDLGNEGVIELWVVEDEEKNMFLSKTLVLHPSQMHIVNSICLRVQGTTRNGEIILAHPDKNLFNIFVYDLQKNHMKKVEIKGTPNRHLTEICEILGLDDAENLIYL